MMSDIEAIVAYLVFAACIIGIFDLARWAMNKLSGTTDEEQGE